VDLLLYFGNTQTKSVGRTLLFQSLALLHLAVVQTTAVSESNADSMAWPALSYGRMSFIKHLDFQ